MWCQTRHSKCNTTPVWDREGGGEIVRGKAREIMRDVCQRRTDDIVAQCLFELTMSVDQSAPLVHGSLFLVDDGRFRYCRFVQLMLYHVPAKEGRCDNFDVNAARNNSRNFCFFSGLIDRFNDRWGVRLLDLTNIILNINRLLFFHRNVCHDISNDVRRTNNRIIVHNFGPAETGGVNENRITCLNLNINQIWKKLRQHRLNTYTERC